MHNKPPFYRVCFFLLICILLFCGCSSKGSPDAPTDNSRNSTADTGAHSSGSVRRRTRHEFLLPEASGQEVYGNDIVSVDVSNTSEGYLMVKYTGNADKARLQLHSPGDTIYSYNLLAGSYAAFPLSEGNGSYRIDILEHAYDKMYALVFSQDIDVAISDPFSPFLYPNQYVWFTPDCEAVQYGIQFSDESENDLDYVEQVYNYVITNISYDKETAANISSDYLPDIDRTLATGKGICFDYASLMASLLRSQGIPTKLDVGYSGTAYHAWISVYLEEAGWIDQIICFDGKNWSLMDPTLAASNDPSSVKKYIGDGSNYTVKYSY